MEVQVEPNGGVKISSGGTSAYYILIVIGGPLMFIFMVWLLNKYFVKVPKPILNVEEAKEVIQVFKHYVPKYGLEKKPSISSQLLGKGNFGTVHRGTIPGHPEPVAIKRPKPGSSEQDIKNFVQEAECMAKYDQNVNLVRLLKIYMGDLKQGEIWIITEYCEFGSLKDVFGNMSKSRFAYIEDLDVIPAHNRPNIGFKDLLLWSLAVAEGMEYLSNKKIVHMDLAARNILVTGYYQAKIADFGLSQKLKLSGEDYYTGHMPEFKGIAPWRWLAIESISQGTTAESRRKFSIKSDVWSYGILLWEIFSLGQVPYPQYLELPGGGEMYFVQLLRTGLRNECPDHATCATFDQISQCWEEDEDSRPTFPNLVQFFKEQLEEMENLNDEMPDH